jgi:hypothetical protein
MRAPPVPEGAQLEKAANRLDHLIDPSSMKEDCQYECSEFQIP